MASLHIAARSLSRELSGGAGNAVARSAGPVAGVYGTVPADAAPAVRSAG
jgi:hypothetical protein